jgi:diadenylate cyclase
MNEIVRIGFLSITFVDLIDIGIITIFIFWLYRALRDTVAVQILLGLVILIVLSFLTEAINLRSLNWILRAISDIWLIAFIILFQPEIRRLLMQITRTKVFKIFIKQKNTKTIDIIAEAVIELSEKHVGALIVFPRSQNVEMTIDRGILLHALISKELIQSIFNTKSPLHDGAIVIDGQNILSARCVLPLSATVKYSGSSLGTRHRAALGLTEQVDSFVLIVSEETGFISIADGGELTLNIPKEKLVDTLNERMTKN